MKVKLIMLSVGIFVGIFLGVIGVFFTLMLTNGVDFLATGKGYTVTLKNDLILTENKEKKLTLPKGTKLIFKSQYDNVGVFSLGVVIDDLSLIEKSSGVSKYFSEQ